MATPTPIIEAIEQCQCQHVGVVDGLKRDGYKREVQRPGDSEPSACFSLTKKDDAWLLTSSYFIGTDWLEEGHSAIRILPKFNTEEGMVQVNYLSMLEEALKDSRNIDHLDGLLYVDFNRPYIDLPQQDDGLSLFLISEFLFIMSSLTRKGLKKAYYQVEENLSSKVKGKMLVAQNIKKNSACGHHSNAYCRYQEYGVDIPENRLLKAALVEAIRMIEADSKKVDVARLAEIVQFISPKWKKVSVKATVKCLPEAKSNAFYKEYPVAVRLAQMILRCASVNHQQHGGQTTKTPPYRIDMSKLFEMYVLRLLRSRFGHQVEYHRHFYGGQEPDYLLHGDHQQPSCIIDAKYKRYAQRAVEVDDIRQVSGYARLKTIRKCLGVLPQTVIPCLIVYPDLQGEAEIPYFKDWDEVAHYEEMYKVGIRIPYTELKAG